MTNSEQAIREFAEKWARLLKSKDPNVKEMFIAHHNVFVSEHYVSKEDAGYPLEFIEWLIKDQEIFFGELNDEYILNDNIHVGGRKLQTIDELFNYWVNNKK